MSEKITSNEQVYTCYSCPDGRCFSRSQKCKIDIGGQWTACNMPFYEAVDPNDKCSVDITNYLNRVIE